MAEMLFEKKQKFQKGILSKLKTNSWFIVDLFYQQINFWVILLINK